MASIHETAEDLNAAGLMNKLTMRRQTLEAALRPSKETRSGKGRRHRSSK